MSLYEIDFAFVGSPYPYSFPTAVAVHGSTVVLAIRQSGIRFLTSTDGGTTFSTLSATYGNTTAEVTRLLYANGMFISATYQIDSGLYLTSPDGITWSIQFYPAFTTQLSTFDMVWNGTYFICAQNDAASIKRVIYSSDGINWTTGATGNLLLGLATSPNGRVVGYYEASSIANTHIFISADHGQTFTDVDLGVNLGGGHGVKLTASNSVLCVFGVTEVRTYTITDTTLTIIATYSNQMDDIGVPYDGNKSAYYDVAQDAHMVFYANATGTPSMLATDGTTFIIGTIPIAANNASSTGWMQFAYDAGIGYLSYGSLRAGFVGYTDFGSGAAGQTIPIDFWTSLTGTTQV